MSYCEFTKDLDESHPHRIYHDKQYGFPIEEDNELFGRLLLEINQAGLNWLTILKKEQNFRKAFDNFDIKKVANYKDHKKEELLQNAGIIRNRLKVEAAIYNANKILELQKEHGSFKNWLDQYVGQSLKEWVALFKKNFKFTGGMIVEEFLMSTGYLKGAHDNNCEVYKEIIKLEPRWKIKLK